MIEIRELKNSESRQRTKRAENFHKHSHAAILPTDAFKPQIGASSCAGKHPCNSSEKYVLKASFSRSIVNKPGKLPIMHQRKAKMLFCRKFLKSYGPVCVLVKTVKLRSCYILRSVFQFLLKSICRHRILEDETAVYFGS